MTKGAEGQPRHTLQIFVATDHQSATNPPSPDNPPYGAAVLPAVPAEPAGAALTPAPAASAACRVPRIVYSSRVVPWSRCRTHRPR